jgi:Fe-S-cluster containining protein
MTRQSPKQFVALSQNDDESKACMAEMIARLEAILALDGLERFATERTLPEAFFSEYAAALDAYDRYIAHIIAAEPLAVTCKAGCDACCRHELARGVTPVEILAIYRLVRPWDDIGAVYEAAGESAVAFQRLLKEQIEADPRPLAPSDDPRVLEAHLRYNQLQRPCAFLDQGNGVCRIYPVRPLVCRWFYNLSPAEWCAPPHPHHLHRNAVGIDPYREVNRLMSAISRRLGVETLNYLPGAFAHLAGDVMQGRPIAIVDAGSRSTDS